MSYLFFTMKLHIFIYFLVAVSVIVDASEKGSLSRRLKRQTDRCNKNAFVNKYGECQCIRNMITFKRDNQIFCEKCPGKCPECMGTKYFCDLWVPYHDYDGKPVVCSDPPPGMYIKHGKFEMCSPKCHHLEIQKRDCGCGNRLCQCPKGIYRDVYKDCTKKCSKCMNVHHIRVSTGECDSMPEGMRCLERDDPKQETTTSPPTPYTTKTKPISTLSITPSISSTVMTTKSPSTTILSPTTKPATTTKNSPTTRLPLTTKSTTTTQNPSTTRLRPTTKSATTTKNPLTTRLPPTTKSTTTIHNPSTTRFSSTIKPTTTTKNPPTARLAPTTKHANTTIDFSPPNHEGTNNYDPIATALLSIVAITLVVMLVYAFRKRLRRAYRKFRYGTPATGGGYKKLPDHIKEKNFHDMRGKVEFENAFISMMERIEESQRRLFTSNKIETQIDVPNRIFDHLRSKLPSYKVIELCQDLREIGVKNYILTSFTDDIQHLD